MPFLGWIARAWLLRRLFGGYGRQSRYGRRGGLFPFPHLSTRTRGGTRVSVGGCCLPIPLALSIGLAATVRLVVRR